LALYKRLYDTVVKSGGFVFIIIHPHYISGEPSAYCRLFQLVKSFKQGYECITDREILEAVSSVGFELCYERMYHCQLNVENPDDAFMSLFLGGDGRGVNESVRQAAKEVFGDFKHVHHDIWLGIFRKP